VRLPAADDLFRPTVTPAQQEPEAQEDEPEAPEPAEGGAAAGGHRRQRGGRRPSGRVRHDEKMTVYVTADELLDLEHARLLLRRDHGLAVDRGRFVREAVALALADLDARGEESVIVQRLKQA
jgi:hypothetical protein